MRKLQIEQDPQAGIVTIEGTRYAYEFFDIFACEGAFANNIGTVIRIAKKEDGTVYLEKVSEEHPE